MDADSALNGLRRRDAAVLVGIDYRPDDTRRLRWFQRAVLMRVFRLRSSLRRLEVRGLVEPGWIVKRNRTRAEPTPAGKRAARAAAVMLELERFAGR